MTSISLYEPSWRRISSIGLTYRHQEQLFIQSSTDVRTTDAYANAAKLLDAAETMLKRAQSSDRPRQVLVLAVSVRDVVAEDGTDTPAGALDVLSKVAGVSGIKVVHEGADGTEARGFLDLRGSGYCFVGTLFELLDDEVRIVHGDLRDKRANTRIKPTREAGSV